MGFDPKDYEEPVFLVYYLRSLARAIGIDLEQLKEKLYRDDIDFVGEKLRRYWDKEGVSYNESDLINCDTAFNTVCEWARYKKAYDFHPAFVDYLKDTEDAPIYGSVLNRLPFKDFYINLGRRKMDLESGVFPEWVRGMFVRLFPIKDGVYIGITVQCERPDGEWIFLSHRLVVGNGDTFQQTMDRQKMVMQKDRIVEKVKKDWAVFYRIAVNACQYLCASNAEIHDVKSTKGNRPVVRIDGKMRPVSVQISEVGVRLGKKFEKMYRNAENGQKFRGDSKGRSPCKPHVRRAHWHHYWTGPGRTVLELRWLEPVFVMGDSEKIDVVVHNVSGENAVTERKIG